MTAQRLRRKDLPSRFVFRGDGYAFNRLADGPTLSALDPLNPRVQKLPLLSGRVLEVTGAEIADIRHQVFGIDLNGDGIPDDTPFPDAPEVAVFDQTLLDRIAALEAKRPEACELTARVEDLERRVAALESQSVPTPAAPETEPPKTNPLQDSNPLLETPLPEGEGSEKPVFENEAPAGSGGDDALGPEAWRAALPEELSDLVHEGETLATFRRRQTELLNVEKAELRNRRAAGIASEQDRQRETWVDLRLGELARLGER